MIDFHISHVNLRHCLYYVFAPMMWDVTCSTQIDTHNLTVIYSSKLVVIPNSNKLFKFLIFPCREKGKNSAYGTHSHPMFQGYGSVVLFWKSWHTEKDPVMKQLPGYIVFRLAITSGMFPCRLWHPVPPHSGLGLM